MTKKINPEELYTTNELVDMDIDRQFGLTKAKSVNVRRQMMLRFIREGRIKAKNLGSGKRPRYVVFGRDVIHYRDAQVKAGEYITK